MLVKSFISTLLLVKVRYWLFTHDMKYNLTCILKASTAAAVGSATADLAVDPFAAYGVEELEWEFPTPDSGSVVVKGTIEQALTQLSENHPEVVPFTSATSNDVASLAKRSDFHNARFNCDWGQYGNVYRIGIEKGIEYLRNLNGRPRNGPGPGNCGRVSCSYGNAIHWCNDASFYQTSLILSEKANIK